MGLAERSQLGPYLILAPLGAGGMGEVYRARDTRLGREVALKVLPFEFAAQPERLERFEREARTVGSLSHPNVLAIYDVGLSGECPYLVSELLEGETLGVRLSGGSLSPRRALDIALQMARGLGAVHAKGIVHRDLKPDNVFLTSDGQVKLLDFGLAKPLAEPSTKDGPTSPASVRDLTETGVVMGTVSYMSPEQIRGQAVDARADVFAFGVVLYEMLSGKRPFQGPSAAETMNAILKEDPPELVVPKGELSPAMDRLVRHCLEKAPEARFQSVQDLAYDLETLLSGASSRPSLGIARVGGRRFEIPAAVLGCVVLLAVLGAFFAGRRPLPPTPAFQRLTFRKGTVPAARFADQGQSLVYAAAWDEAPVQIFTGRPGSPESRGLDLERAHLLAVSARGELAVSLRVQAMGWLTWGTLARVPLAGGAPRESLGDVQFADFDPAGKDLAVVRYEKGLCRLEYPPGTLRAQTSGWFSHPRFSPDGARIAYVDHPMRSDDRGGVAVFEVARGASRPLGPVYSSLQGVAWAPGAREVWFTAAESGVQRRLRAVDLKGGVRDLLDVPGGLWLMDVDQRGDVLVAHTQSRSGIYFQGPEGAAPRELSWLNWSLLHGLSPDGKWVIFDEEGVSEGPDYGLYLRGTDGSPAIRLGDGVVPALSLDRQWVLAGQHRPSPRLVLLPTGAGTPRVLPLAGLEAIHHLLWMPDGRRFLLFATERGKGPTVYLQSLEDSVLKPLRGPSFLLEEGGPLSPDGRWLCLREERIGPALLDLEHPEAPSRPIPGLEPQEVVAQWTEDPAWVYLIRGGAPNRSLVRLRLSDGRREPVRELGAIRGVPRRVLLTPDGKSLAYTYAQNYGDLYRITGLR